MLSSNGTYVRELIGSVRAALVDPALPLLLAGGAAAALASGVLGRTVLLPRLKQLPPAAVRLETVRQTLLAQVLVPPFLTHKELVWHELRRSSCSCPRPTFAAARFALQRTGGCLHAEEDARSKHHIHAARASRCADGSGAAQHTLLAQRAGELVGDASADVRALARLWQLRNKMGAVGGGGTYGALPCIRSVCLGAYFRADYWGCADQLPAVMEGSDFG